jgi:hypothetical protein
MTIIDPKLIEFATVRQIEYIEAIEKHGGFRPAARALKVGESSLRGSMERLRDVAARDGYAPGHFQSGVAPGFQMGKVTVQRGPDGSVERTWERQSPDEDRMREFMRAAVDAMAEDLPRLAPAAGPGFVNNDLATVYTLTDSHVGAMCWHRENLDPLGDWDLGIAERTLTGCFEHMIKASPDSRIGVVAQLGDFGHQDGLSPVTPTSFHVLDSDSRFPKIVETMVRILRRVIAMALAKHEHVVVLLAEGNHDISSSVWMRAMFKALYENEPRVEVIDSVMPYYVYQHGRTMIAWHHGHLKKNDQLPILFASQFPKMWGDTSKRYAHCGHRHHVEEKEHSGMTVIQHSTLAARDAYASRGGWMSERQCTAITYHAEFGQVARSTVTPEMLAVA